MADEATNAVEQQGSRERLLDAAQQILVADGHAGVTTRRVANAAGLNQGLIHYYFGSLDDLFLAVFERFTAQLLARQRAMYAEDRPFLDKWRAAMAYLDEDVADGYQKVWAELYSRALNNPLLLPRLSAAYDGWRDTLREAFREPFDDYGLGETGFTLEDWVTLVITFNAGLGMEMLAGVRTGHRQLLRSIDRWLSARAAS